VLVQTIDCWVRGVFKNTEARYHNLSEHVSDRRKMQIAMSTLASTLPERSRIDYVPDSTAYNGFARVRVALVERQIPQSVDP
jgi:hypothetical protein